MYSPKLDIMNSFAAFGLVAYPADDRRVRRVRTDVKESHFPVASSQFQLFFVCSRGASVTCYGTNLSFRMTRQ